MRGELAEGRDLAIGDLHYSVGHPQSLSDCILAWGTCLHECRCLPGGRRYEPQEVHAGTSGTFTKVLGIHNLSMTVYGRVIIAGGASAICPDTEDFPEGHVAHTGIVVCSV